MKKKEHIRIKAKDQRPTEKDYDSKVRTICGEVVDFKYTVQYGLAKTHGYSGGCTKCEAMMGW